MAPEPQKFLVINPNTSQSMTEGLTNIIKDLSYSKATEVDTFTAPSGTPSINNEVDAQLSCDTCLPALLPMLKSHQYDGFLVACYSVHPLVTRLRSAQKADQQIPVIGIFESSISTSLSLLSPPTAGHHGRVYDKFGIVTTGKYWETVLTEGVYDFLGLDYGASCQRFKGVASTGLNASELHTSPPEEVKARMMDATRRLVRDGDVTVICLGCAGMAGMDEMVREACVKELGDDMAKRIRIVDGVKAGIALLDGLARTD